MLKKIFSALIIISLLQISAYSMDVSEFEREISRKIKYLSPQMETELLNEKEETAPPEAPDTYTYEEQYRDYKICQSLFSVGAYKKAEEKTQEFISNEVVVDSLKFKGTFLLGRIYEKMEDFQKARNVFSQIKENFTQFSNKKLYLDASYRESYYASAYAVYEFDAVTQVIRSYKLLMYAKNKIKEYENKPFYLQFVKFYYQVRLPQLKADHNGDSKKITRKVIRDMKKGEYSKMYKFMEYITRQEKLASLSFLETIQSMRKYATTQLLDAETDGLPLSSFKKRIKDIEEVENYLTDLLKRR